MCELAEEESIITGIFDEEDDLPLPMDEKVQKKRKTEHYERVQIADEFSSESPSSSSNTASSFKGEINAELTNLFNDLNDNATCEHSQDTKSTDHDQKSQGLAFKLQQTINQNEADLSNKHEIIRQLSIQNEQLMEMNVRLSEKEYIRIINQKDSAIKRQSDIIKTLQSGHENKMNEFEKSSEQNEKLQKELEDIQESIKHLHLHIEKKNKEIMELKAGNKQKKTKMSKVNGRFAGFRKRISLQKKDLIKDANKIEDTLKQRSDELRKKDKEILRVTQLWMDKKDAFDTIKIAHDDCTKVIDHLYDELKVKDLMIEETRRESTDLKTEIIKFNKDRRMSSGVIEELKSRVSREQLRMDDIMDKKDALAAMQKTQNEYAGQIDRLHDELNAKDLIIEAAKEKCQELETENIELNKVIEEVKCRDQSHMDELSNAQSEYVQQIDHLHDELKAKDLIVETTEKKCHDLENEQIKFNAEQRILNEVIEELKCKEKLHMAQILDLTEKDENKSEQMKQLRQNLINREIEIKRLTHEIAVKDADTRKANEIIDELKRSEQSHIDQIMDKKDAFDAMKKVQHEYVDQIDCLHKELEAKDLIIKTTKESCQELEDENIKLNADRKMLNKALENAQSEHAEQMARLQDELKAKDLIVETIKKESKELQNENIKLIEDQRMSNEVIEQLNRKDQSQSAQITELSQKNEIRNGRTKQLKKMCKRFTEILGAMDDEVQSETSTQ